MLTNKYFESTIIQMFSKNIFNNIDFLKTYDIKALNRKHFKIFTKKLYEYPNKKWQDCYCS